MIGPANETVGENFQVDLLQAARDKTLALLNETASLLKPGMRESEARELLAQLQVRRGAEKNWHPPQIRFGESTLNFFGLKSKEDVVLKETDIFFMDIGPIFDGHEGDVGRTFTVGDNPEFKKCAEDVKKLWCKVRDQWSNSGMSGAELYRFAGQEAERLGWKLSLQKANGHRIADYPHAARFRGSIEGWESHPQSHRWILEMQIRHPEKPFGAFYEDLLI